MYHRVLILRGHFSKMGGDIFELLDMQIRDTRKVSDIRDTSQL